jgi:protein transport protein SEC61 subunit alpha
MVYHLILVPAAFSPTTVNTGRGSEFESAIVALFHLLFTWNDKARALREAFWKRDAERDGPHCDYRYFCRHHLPARLPYRDSSQVQLIPWTSRKLPRQLFYTSNIFIVSPMLASRFPDNFFVKILGIWEVCYPSPRISPITLTCAHSCSPWKTHSNSLPRPASPTCLCLGYERSCPPSHSRCDLYHIRALCLFSLLRDLDPCLRKWSQGCR